MQVGVYLNQHCVI